MKFNHLIALLEDTDDDILAGMDAYEEFNTPIYDFNIWWDADTKIPSYIGCKRRLGEIAENYLPSINVNVSKSIDTTDPIILTNVERFPSPSTIHKRIFSKSYERVLQEIKKIVDEDKIHMPLHDMKRIENNFKRKDFNGFW